MNPTNEQELRTQIRNTLYNHEIGFSLANANGRTPEQMVEELIDALLYPVTAHTNAEIAKVLNRLDVNKETLYWWTGGDYERTTAVDMRAIAAERAKLKERDDE